MKNKLFTICILLLVSSITFPQMKKHMEGRKGGRLEQLEKIKLIEVLNLSEEANIRLFSRRSEHHKEMENLRESIDNKLSELNEMVKDKSKSETEIGNYLEQYLKLEEKAFQSRNNYLNSLKDILTTEQLTKYIIFERRFKEEVRDAIFKERLRKRK